MMRLQISLLNNTLAHTQLSVVWLARDQAPCVICTPQTQPPLRGITEYVLCTAGGGPQGLGAAAWCGCLLVRWLQVRLVGAWESAACSRCECVSACQIGEGGNVPFLFRLAITSPLISSVPLVI